MKKIFSVILSVCIVLAMSLSLAACGSSDDNSSSVNDAPSSSEDNSSEQSSEDESDDVTGKFATIQDFIDSDIMQSQLKDVMKQVEDAGMKLEVYGEENTLVYAYTYAQDMGDISAALEEAMKAQADTFKNVAKSIPLAVEIDEATVVVKYLNPDGSEIYSAEFKAE